MEKNPSKQKKQTQKNPKKQMARKTPISFQNLFKPSNTDE